MVNISAMDEYRSGSVQHFLVKLMKILVSSQLCRRKYQRDRVVRGHIIIDIMKTTSIELIPKEQDHKQSSNDDKHREKSTARDSISRKAAPGRELYGKRSGRSPRRERSPKRFKSEPRGPRSNVKEKEEENSQTTTFVQPKTEFIINSSPVKDLTRPNIIMRKSSIYERVLQVGEGTYGKVYKAKNVDTGHMAALKRLRMESERDGMPITAIREIKLLQSLRHHSIVSLREMIIEEGYIYMAFEYLDHDLAGILAHPTLTLGHGQVKYLFKQMMEGLSYLHHKNILHRDIKGSNILVDNEGNIKLADFGLARKVNLENKDAHYTNRVITLWYRPPELLLGATMYCGAIDVWGMGCLLVELFNRKAIFQGRDEIEQLSCIYDIMGTPTTEEWPSMLELPWYQMLLPSEPKPSRFMQEFSSVLVTGSAADLASKLLALNPNKRATSDEALTHAYFSEDPAPEKLDLKGIGEWHDFEAKKRRRKEREEKKRREVEEKMRDEIIKSNAYFL